MNKMLAAVLIPIVGLFVWVVRLHYTIASGIEVRLNVTGYDPRDLLAGHFVQYQVNYELDDICTKTPDSINVCVCLGFSPTEKRFVGHWSGPCEQRPTDTCERYYIGGYCEHGRFLSGIERFYIPEEYSPVMVTVPPQSSISVALNGKGQGLVTKLYVGEQTLDEYAREKLATLPPQ